MHVNAERETGVMRRGKKKSCVYSLLQTTLLRTHIRGDPSAVFDRVALDGDVVDLSVRVGENKVLPGRDGLARLRPALCILQEAAEGKKGSVFGCKQVP